MQTTRLIRCDVTKNPVGTDARMIGEPPCDCQGCFCARLIDDLQADLRNVLKAALYNEPNGADLVYRLTTFALAKPIAWRDWRSKGFAVPSTYRSVFSYRPRDQLNFMPCLRDKADRLRIGLQTR